MRTSCMAEKRILFADPDPRVLDDFREAVGSRWTVTGVVDGKAALAEMKRQEYEILVTSLDLPEVDGPRLLNRTRQRHPGIVRFIVASESERERVVKSVLGAHQFLTRPFNKLTLKGTLERAVSLDRWIENDRIRALVSRARTLPPIPSVYLELVAALRSPSVETAEVGAIIGRDMALMTKLLQVINSSYFGLPRRITDPAEAVGLLGFDTVKSMVLAVKLLNTYDRNKAGQFSIDRLWRHSMDVAQVAKVLALRQTFDPVTAETAYTGGLLHDVGKVILALNFDEEYIAAQDQAKSEQLPLWEVEAKVFGASHAEVGAYLLGLWGMPLDLLEIAAHHHHPERGSLPGFSALTAVHVANALVRELAAEKEEVIAPQIDAQYLAEMNLAESVDGWREICKETLAGPVTKPSSDTVIRTRGWTGPRAPGAAGSGSGNTVVISRPVERLRSPEPAPVAAAAAAQNGGPNEQSAQAVAATSTTRPTPSGSTAFWPKPDASPPPARRRSIWLYVGAAVAACLLLAFGYRWLSPGNSPDFPELKLEGILDSSAAPTAVINGQTLHPNDTVEGAVVLQISASAVTLQFNGQRRVLTLDGKTAP